MNKFQKDLKQGKKYEKIALNYLEYDTVEHIEGNFKEYDFIITIQDEKYKIEVKSDRQASSTGNLAIEYECNNKLSGISTSLADFWIYFIVYPDRDECYKIPTNELKEIIKNCKSVIGGDNNLSKMYLINKLKLKQYLIKKIKNDEDNEITLKNLPFGKYKNRKIKDIASIDISYLKWLYNQKTIYNNLKDEIKKYI